jgi:hypothetical protein
MRTNLTPGYWLASAIDARAVAVALSDPEAKLAWELLADQCEELAQIVGSVLAERWRLSYRTA